MAKRLLTSQDLLRFRLVGDVAVSSDGSQIAFVVQTTNQEQNRYDTAIYLAKGGSDPVPFTRGESDKKPCFTPDGQYLAFLSKRSGQSQVWRIPLGGGEAQQLTKIHGGVKEFAFAPDSQNLAVIAEVDASGVVEEHKNEEKDLYKKWTQGVKIVTELHYKLDDYGFFGSKRPQVVLVPLDGTAPRQLTELPYRHSNLAWAKDGQTIYTAVNREADYDEWMHSHLWAVPVSGGAARRLTPTHLGAGRAAVSPDGTQIAFLATNLHGMGYDNTGLYVMNLDGSGLRRVGEAADRTFANISGNDMPAPDRADLTWTPDGSAIYTLSSNCGKVHVSRVDLATGVLTDVVAGDRVVYGFAVAPEAGVVATAITDAVNPGEIFRHDLATRREQQLTQINAEIFAEVAIATPERFTAQAEGGPRVDGWVIKPTEFVAGKRYPTVLQIHGGPMTMYASSFFFEFQLLAAQGYGVVYTNPRGSQGYGEKFCADIRTEWGNLDLVDIYAGMDTAIAQNDWIDPERLGVAGGSYGGYMTNWIVGHTDRFKAAVSSRCVSDWQGMVGNGDINWLWIRRAEGVHPFGQDEHAWYRQQSPITYAENIVTPILFEAQEGDLRCPIEQTESIYTVVKKLGKAPTRFVRYPDEFHGMCRTGKPWHRIHRLDEIVNWFVAYLPR